jgi:hypothetical protein
MLYQIRSLTDKFAPFLRDDPVRPHIDHELRIGKQQFIFAAVVENKPNAITCVSLTGHIPQVEEELFADTQPTVAVFYTIWSYAPGSGRQLIYDSVQYIRSQNTNISRFVTLSPKTEMAYKFHIKNGAVVLRENLDTINYEYRV